MVTYISFDELLSKKELDILVQKRRNKQAVMKFFDKSLKGQQE